jgi:hypothetical protein
MTRSKSAGLVRVRRLSTKTFVAGTARLRGVEIAAVIVEGPATPLT